MPRSIMLLLACAYRETRNMRKWTHADTGGRAQAVQPFNAQKSNERLTGMRQAVVKTRERQPIKANKFDRGAGKKQKSCQ